MDIIKKCYDITKEEIENMSKLIESEDSLSSGNEIKLRVENIIQICETKFKNIERIANKSKMKKFERISEKILEEAECMGVNIHVKTENDLLGRITIESEYTWLDSGYNRRNQFIMAELFITASDVMIYTESNLYKMDFFYELYDEVTIA